MNFAKQNDNEKGPKYMNTIEMCLQMILENKKESEEKVKLDGTSVPLP
jgi:hypothetical protein